VVCSWLFERAAHWVLDRFGVMGQVGAVLLANDDEEEFEEDADDSSLDDKPVVNDNRQIPNRKIYCLDFKSSTKADDFIDEVKRIHAENAVNVVTLGDVVGGSGSLPIASAPVQPDEPSADSESGQVNRIEESGGRRWYPVIDYNRCTNCMECIDFCLFGVYGVDRIDTILVEQPDNCRKGCPACSRVCPENAIMFPQHKTPAIAGSNDAAASMKIDLSQLFGAPASGKSAEEVAAMERDEQLLLAGRDAVGMTGSLPKRSTGRTEEAKDKLDDLVDQLNDLDL
jgi:NAD-dependent dihydropyrimidine dehydrogenase PreA subunit